MEPVWSTVEVDANGISTPVYLPAEGGDGDSWVDENGTIQFAEEFSGCLDHGDHDDFRNERVRPCISNMRVSHDIYLGVCVCVCVCVYHDFDAPAASTANRLRAQCTTGLG